MDLMSLSSSMLFHLPKFAADGFEDSELSGCEVKGCQTTQLLWLLSVAFGLVSCPTDRNPIRMQL